MAVLALTVASANADATILDDPIATATGWTLAGGEPCLSVAPTHSKRSRHEHGQPLTDAPPPSPQVLRTSLRAPSATVGRAVASRSHRKAPHPSHHPRLALQTFGSRCGWPRRDSAQANNARRR